MREVLFKGKRKDNGEWIEGHLLWYEDRRARIIPSHTDVFCYENDENTIQTVAYEVIPETVGQYTGLTDKNGKKIFEDDIIKCDGFIGIVKFNVAIASFIVVINDTTSEYYHYSLLNKGDLSRKTQLKHSEVIGNIQDNFELFNNALSEAFEEKFINPRKGKKPLGMQIESTED